jgi:glucose/arabinose dehydrogenase
VYIKLRLNNSRFYFRFWCRFWETVSGRPVDVLVMPDGALLISDDKAGVIYRVRYQP